MKRFSSYGPYGDASARNEEDDDDDLDGLDGSCEEDRLGPKLKYTPAPGKFCRDHFFCFDSRTYAISIFESVSNTLRGCVCVKLVGLVKKDTQPFIPTCPKRWVCNTAGLSSLFVHENKHFRADILPTL